MAIDKVLSSSIANGAVTAALISNTANLVVSSLTANVITITTISGSANVTGDMTVGGNLTISGTTTYVNTTDLNIGDAIISLNADLAANVSPTEDAGISINRGASTNAQFKWIESTDNWSIGNTTVSGVLTSNDHVITGTANVSTGINVGANVNLSTSQINVGNSTVNTVITSTSLTTTSNTVSIGTAAYFVANGNLGLGVTPSAWGSLYKVLQQSNYGSALVAYTSAPYTFLGSNWYNNGTNDLYVTSNSAGIYRINGDTHAWFQAPSGTAGANASFTQAMTLDSSGRLLVGKTSGISTVDVIDIGNGGVRVTNGTTDLRLLCGASEAYLYNASNVPTIFSVNTTERMRIDTSGNLGIGTVTPTQKLDVNGTINANGIQTSGNASLVFGASKWMVQQETANQSLMYYCGANSSTYGTHYLYRATSTGSPLITMTYAANGNIGVGNTVPATKLHVFQRSDAGAAPSTPEIRIEHQDINAISTGGSNGGILSFVNIQRDATAWANNSIWGRINFNPSQPTSGTAQLGASILAAADGALFGLQSASYLAFYTSDYTNGGNTGEKMRISAGGSVGIGSTAPANKLDVRGILGIGTAGTSSLNSFTIESVNTSAQNHTHIFSGPSAGTNDVLGFYLNRGGGSYGEFFVSFNSTYRFFVPGSTLNNNGDAYIMPPRYLGIGTTSPSYILDVNGIARVTGFQNNSLYSYTMIGTYTGGTWYTITDGGTMAQPGVYICTAYVDNYNLGGAVYYYTFASVPFYWGGNTIGSNGATAQVLPTMYGTGHALNSQTPPSLRINERYSSQTLQLQFSFQSTFTFDGTGGRNLSFSFTKIA